MFNAHNFSVDSSAETHHQRRLLHPDRRLLDRLSNESSLAVAALEHAVVLRSPVATTLHSDRGSQFRPRKFVHALLHNGLQGSMGRVGACGDNAAMQSFFAGPTTDAAGNAHSADSPR